MVQKRYSTLCVEPLEDRLALAGNVTAAFSGTTLRITGDDLSNAVNIFQLNATQIRIQGANDGNNVATTVGGGAFQDLTFGAGNSLQISMRGGNDIVVLGSAGGLLTAMNKLGADLATGADNLLIVNSQITNGGNKTSLTLGKANEGDIDMFSAKSSTFAGHVNVTTGGGGDGVEFDTVTVGRTLTVDVGSGNDNVIFNALTVDRLTAKLSDGNDTFNVSGGLNVNSTGNKTTIDALAGDDAIQITGLVNVKNLLVLNIGEGNNTVAAAGSTITAEKGLTITGGAGSEVVTLATVRTAALTVDLKGASDAFTSTDVRKTALERADLTIRMGGGNDAAVVSNVLARKCTIDLGDDNDALTATTCDVSMDLLFNGGAGADVQSLSGIMGPTNPQKNRQMVNFP